MSADVNGSVVGPIGQRVNPALRDERTVLDAIADEMCANWFDGDANCELTANGVHLIDEVVETVESALGIPADTPVARVAAALRVLDELDACVTDLNGCVQFPTFDIKPIVDAAALLARLRAVAVEQ